jgi:hypothetical protein
VDWIEKRIVACEDRLEYLIRYIQDLRQQIVAAAQAARTASASYGVGGAASSDGAYLCMAPSSGSWAATGTWPALTPGSFTATVYSVQGSTITSVGSFTVYNWFPSTPANSKVCLVEPDGAGNFVTVTQSCT